MKVQFNFIHLDVSDALKDYTVTQLNTLGKFMLKEGQGHCYFSKTKSKFHVEITVNTRQKYYKATSAQHDIYAAVDDVMDKLQRQFVKVKKVYKNHKHFEMSKEGKIQNLNAMLEIRVPRKKVA